VVAGIVCFLLLGQLFHLAVNFFDEEQTVASGKSARQQQRRRSAGIIAGCSLAFFGLLVGTIYGAQSYRSKMKLLDQQARGARYEACLGRTTAEVCEIHWVQLPKPGSSGDGPTLVITPDGKIGTGLGL